MFDLGLTELLLIGIVALIVVGPKDLPMMFRQVGKFVGKARSMTREFSRAMDDAADGTGIKDISKTLKAASQPVQTGMDSVRKAASDLTKYDPESETGKLAAKRKKTVKKAKDTAVKKAQERQESAQAEQQKTAEKKPKATAKKTAAKKPVAKKPAAKKSVAKPTVGKAAAQKSVTKSASKKSASKTTSKDKA